MYQFCNVDAFVYRGFWCYLVLGWSSSYAVLQDAPSKIWNLQTLHLMIDGILGHLRVNLATQTCHDSLPISYFNLFCHCWTIFGCCNLWPYASCYGCQGKIMCWGAVLRATRPPTFIVHHLQFFKCRRIYNARSLNCERNWNTQINATKHQGRTCKHWRCEVTVHVVCLFAYIICANNV